MVAQLLLLGPLVFALAKTFWPKRSMALPTIPSGSKPAVKLAAEVAAIREQNERLRAHIAMLEEAISGGDTNSNRHGTALLKQLADRTLQIAPILATRRPHRVDQLCVPSDKPDQDQWHSLFDRALACVRRAPSSAVALMFAKHELD